MNINQALEMAVFAGEVMLSSGAETARVEDTMERILSRYPGVRVEVMATPTGIQATLYQEGEGMCTLVRRVKTHSFHMGKIAMVNALSRSFVEGCLTIEEALQQLQNIQKQPPYSNKLRIVASGVACMCFTYTLGGSLLASAISGAVGLVLFYCVLFMGKHRINSVLLNLAGGGIIALMVLPTINLFPYVLPGLDKIIAGSIIPLIPGVGFTNAIRDVLGGNYLSGTSRLLDAVLVAVCIASGIGCVMTAWISFFGGVLIV